MLDIFDGEQPVGTGVLIDQSGHVVTAAHCLARYPDPRAAGADFSLAEATLYRVGRYGRSKKAAFAVLLGFEPVLDVAILHILDGTYYDAPEAWWKQGERLLKQLLPVGLAEWDALKTRFPVRVLDRKSGWLRATAKTQPGWKTISLEGLSAPIVGGTSGSPVFDDQDRVVGIISCMSVAGTPGKIEGRCLQSTAVNLQSSLPPWLTRQREITKALNTLVERERRLSRSYLRQLQRQMPVTSG